MLSEDEEHAILEHLPFKGRNDHDIASKAKMQMSRRTMIV
jgi:hypothetical protein